MTEFEILFEMVLVILYGALCYICGKGDLLNLIPLMLQDYAKELEKKLESEEQTDESTK